jgi:S-DNA-T family DNA segregation ATPase FtsK/SpoIIIE
VDIKLKLVSDSEDDERFIFRFKIKPGTKVNMILSCAPDIKAAMRIPLFYPFKDGENIYLAVSEKLIKEDSLFHMLTSEMFDKSRYVLPLALGYNIVGRMIFSDLADMPHIMYAGTTNSGKSMGLICLILSLITKQPVRRANLIIFDTGANEMGIFNGISHLSYPVVNDVQTGIYVIGKLVEEMERRIKLELSELRTQPAIICVIDEFTSFVDHVGNKKLSEGLVHAISDLLRRGRHAKIHMVLAAQDPTKENVKVDIGNITRCISMCQIPKLQYYYW